MDEADGVEWLQGHLDYCVAPLLGEPWILDVDMTVKPLYGHQEGAVKGYNPHKPGRPSHTYHTYFIAESALDAGGGGAGRQSDCVQIQRAGVVGVAGRAAAGALAGLMRGDRDWGTQANMAGRNRKGCPVSVQAADDRGGQESRRAADARGRLERCRPGLAGRRDAPCGLGLEPRAPGHRAAPADQGATWPWSITGDPEQLRLSFAEITDDTIVYEYAVLVTSLPTRS